MRTHKDINTQFTSTFTKFSITPTEVIVLNFHTFVSKVTQYNNFQKKLSKKETIIL